MPYLYKRGVPPKRSAARRNTLAVLSRLDFAISLQATRVRRAHAELYAVVFSALHDGVDPKLLARSAGLSLATIRQMSVWSDDEELGSPSQKTHLAHAHLRRAQLQREIDAKADAEERKKLYLARCVPPLG